MLDKILGRDKTSTNIGKNGDIDESGTSNGTVLGAYITFPDLSGGVSEKIGSKLTIGSEIGELVIEDDSLSPRHCTLIKNNDVISIIDHSSVQGTFLNKKRIEPGRTFFIDEKDKLKIGGLKAIIQMLEVPAFEEIEEEYVEEEPIEEKLIEPQGLEIDDLEALSLEGKIYEDENNSNITVSRFLNGEVEDVEEPSHSVRKVPIPIPLSSTSEIEFPEEEVTPDIPEVPEKDVAYYFDNDNSSSDINAMDLEEVELDESVLEDFKKAGSAKKLKLEGSRKRGKRKRGIKREDVKEAYPKKKSKVSFPATHIVFRFLGLFFDILFCLTLLNIFYVFVDFQNFYNGFSNNLKMGIKSFYDSSLATHYESLIISVPQIDGLVQDISSYDKFNSVFAFICLLFGVRILSTLFLSVSLGNAVIGVRVHGHSLLKRALGVLREIIGIFTFPFVVFDLPTFMGKRSFKEIITKTHIYTPSRITTTFLCVFFTPVFLFTVCFSPIIKGFEFLDTVSVEEAVSKTKPWSYENKVYSDLIGVSYELSQSYTTLPSFQIEVKNKKRFLTFGLVFINKENGMSINIKKVKEFSMLSIYKDFVDLNILSEYFQPAIYSLVKDVSHKNGNFKRNSSNIAAIKIETQSIIKSIFSLEMDNTYDFIINNGPMIAGFRDFREKIESLIGEKIRKIKFTTFARKAGFLTEHKVGKRVFFYFIPIGDLEGKVFYLSEDISLLKLKAVVGHIDFKKEEGIKGSDPIAEFTKGFKLDPSFENFELAQAVYDRYFEIGKHFLTTNNQKGLNFLQSNLNKVISVLQEDKLKNKKLFLNLSEVKEALKNKDDNFFNIKRSVTVSI